MTKFAKINRADRRIVQVSNSPITIEKNDNDHTTVQVEDDAQVGDIAAAGEEASQGSAPTD